MTTRTDDLRQTLAERVRRRVTGRGVPRHVIEATVERVVQTLESTTAAATVADTSPADTILVAFSSASHPDLASRLRAAFARDGIAVGAGGGATAGRFTVATFALPASARARAEEAARMIGARCLVMRNDADAGYPVG